MNRLRITGLISLVAFLVGVAVFVLWPAPPPPAPPPPPPREAFHPTKPLRVHVQLASSEQSTDAPPAWFSRELRYSLTRGKMKLAPEGAAIDAGTKDSFTLRITLQPDLSRAAVELVAPDGIVDKRTDIELSQASRLATMQSLAGRLSPLLGAPEISADGFTAFGTGDAQAYEDFLRSGDELLGPESSGFTAPPRPANARVAPVERLETLNRRHRDFARARALLSLSYLSVGGDDQASLSKLAETAAERALAADADLADAHAALGVVRMRRMEWAAAQEHFDAALSVDPNSLPALEGLGCLLMDVGRAAAALPIALRSAALQPGNRGARQCASYAQIGTGKGSANAQSMPPDIARIYATMALLADDRATAEQMLRTHEATTKELIDSIIDASESRSKIPDALRVITRSADEETIDAESELLFGSALRRADFVFNRILRLAQQNEAAPLRMLWLPQTEFLRKHRRFKEVVSATTLTTYWQDHALPDICASEPKVSGCAMKPK